jgi:hypothetical protein
VPDLSSALRSTAVALLILSVAFLGVSVVAISNRIYLIGGLMQGWASCPSWAVACG